MTRNNTSLHTHRTHKKKKKGLGGGFRPMSASAVRRDHVKKMNPRSETSNTKRNYSTSNTLQKENKKGTPQRLTT